MDCNLVILSTPSPHTNSLAPVFSLIISLPITPYSMSSPSSPERISSSSPYQNVIAPSSINFVVPYISLKYHHQHYQRFCHLHRLQLYRRRHCLIKHHCLVDLMVSPRSNLDIHQPVLFLL